MACKHLDRHLETDLVQTPRVPVEQDLHTVIQHRLGFLAGQQQAFLFPSLPGGFSVFVSFPQQRLGEMRGEPGSQSRGLVSRPQEIYVSEETGERACPRSERQQSDPSSAPTRSIKTASASPLAILDPTQDDGVPKRVHLAPPRVHDIAQVLVDLFGGQGRVGVSGRLGAFFGATVRKGDVMR